MNQQHLPHTSAPATLWDAVVELNRLRDTLVEVSLALHDLQFDLEDDTCRVARETALLWMVKAFSGNAPGRLP